MLQKIYIVSGIISCIKFIQAINIFPDVCQKFLRYSFTRLPNRID